MKKLLTSLVLAATLTAQAAVTLPFFEAFPASYGQGTLLGAGATAVTWDQGNGTAATSAIVNSNAALTYSGLTDGSGYGISSTTSSSRNRGVDFGVQTLSAANPTVYASFLVKVVSVPTVNKCLFYFRATAGSGTPHAGAFVNPAGQLTISKNNATPAAVNTAALTVGDTYLAVLRYKFIAAANDEVALWLNPASSSFSVDEASVPAATISTTANSDLTTMQAFFVAGLVADTSVQYMDEVRLGLTWASVTPSSVCTPASISTNPVSQGVAVGDTANFTVTALGSSRTYQWQLSTDNGTSWNNVASAGNGASYTTPTLVAGDNGSKFRCVANVSCDSSSATSGVATLTVADPTGKWFRSVTSGNWNNLATWEQSNDGSTWVAATLTPSAAGSNITVRAGHTVSVTAAANADDLTIEATGELDATGATLTIADGSAAIDCNVSGTLRVTSTASSALATGTAGIRFNNGGKFQWSGASAPTIPTATWADGSLCLIDNTASAAVNCAGISGQSFYDFTVNYPSVAFRTRLNIGAATTIRRHLAITIPDVAAASVMLLTNTGTVLTVGGNFTVNTGVTVNSTKILTRSANTEISTIKVAGNVTINGYMDLFSTATGGLTVFEFNGGSTVLTLDTTHQIVGNTNNVSYLLDTGANVSLATSVPGGTAFTVGTNSGLSTGPNRIYGAAAGSFTMNPGCIIAGSGTNQLTAGFGTINYAGTVNLGTLPSFAGGETFVLFGGSATPTYTGSFTLAPSTPSGSQTWDTTALNTTGTLGVSGGAGPSAGHIDSTTVSGGNVVLTISGGSANTGFSVIATNSLTIARTNWPVVGSGTFNGAGAASVTNPSTGNVRFHSLRVP